MQADAIEVDAEGGMMLLAWIDLWEFAALVIILLVGFGWLYLYGELHPIIWGSCIVLLALLIILWNFGI